jgi:predicted small lipoprotein YifL
VFLRIHGKNLMKALLAASLALSLAACATSDPGPPPQAPGAPASATTASSAPETASSAPADTAAVPATAAPAAPPASSTPSDPGGQRGLASGKVVVVAFKPTGPKGQGLCFAVPGTADELAEFNKDRKKSIAKFERGWNAKKGEMSFLASCPTDAFVGSCLNGFGMLADYYAPTFTVDSAQKHCAGPQMGKWIE